jgi:hypothetical protein
MSCRGSVQYCSDELGVYEEGCDGINMADGGGERF